MTANPNESEHMGQVLLFRPKRRPDEGKIDDFARRIVELRAGILRDQIRRMEFALEAERQTFLRHLNSLAALVGKVDAV